jgi:CHRD domain-containing protein
MRRVITIVAAVTLTLSVVGVVFANGDSNKGSLRASLGGLQEVPSILTTGSGKLSLKVNAAGNIDYTLTFANLKGGAAGAAHIHIGQPGVSGAVAAFLCGGGTEAACPAAGGTVTGTIVAAEVMAIPAQGLAAGDLPALLKAIRSGVTYVNVHTVTFPGGEIRGQIHGSGRHGDGDNDD